MSGRLPPASLVAMLLVAQVATLAAQPSAEVPAVLDLTLNTAARGEIHVLLAGHEVWADLAALESAGLRRLAGDRRQVGARTFVRLSSIDPEPQAVVDEAALTLTVTADPSLFDRTIVRFDSARPEGIEHRRVPSTFLNYGATWASSGDRAVNLETGVSLGGSLFTSSIFLTASQPTARGLTSLVLDDARRLTRYQVGDALVATGPLGGSLQVAGVSVSRDFSLDPYFVRHPTAELSGVVTTPSRVDVYVNHQLVRSMQVQPGAYELANLLLPNGAADMRVVVRDAFGGQQEFGGSYYVTTSILSKGLQQFQYAFGAERLRPFDTLWDYGRGVLTGVHRIGLTDSVTVGGRVELESGLLSGGPTVTARLGRLGALELGAGTSSHAGRGGLALGVAYEYVGGPGAVSFAWREASDAYRTLTSRRMNAVMAREVLASAMTRLTSRATIGVSWQSNEVAPEGTRDPLRRAGVSSTLTFGPRVSVMVSAGRTEIDGRWTNSGFASVSLGIGPRTTTGMSVQSRDGRLVSSADVQQSAPVGPGVGYRVQANNAAGEMLDGEFRAQTRWAQLDARQSFVEGERQTWMQVNGALVAIGGRVLAARPVQDGYALVRVPDVKGVRAFVSQQEMGRTDGHGDLLVPNLLAYYGNQISIADSDVPVDRSLTRRQLLLAPPYRGGAIAEFPATREWRVAGRVEIAGDPEWLRGQHAIDARVTIATGSLVVSSWLGSDGEFYVEGLPPGRYRLDVESGYMRCRAPLVVPESDAPVIQVGTLSCVPLARAAR